MNDFTDAHNLIRAEGFSLLCTLCIASALACHSAYTVYTSSTHLCFPLCLIALLTVYIVSVQLICIVASQ